jgi:hypothetical protein
MCCNFCLKLSGCKKSKKVKSKCCPECDEYEFCPMVSGVDTSTETDDEDEIVEQDEDTQEVEAEADSDADTDIDILEDEEI